MAEGMYYIIDTTQNVAELLCTSR